MTTRTQSCSFSSARQRRSEGPRSFDVTLLGRWTETDASTATSVRGSGGASTASPQTPLAGSRLEIEIEDADGNRHVTLSSVVANRRYAIGKGEGCDITVNGTFASRRHCEIWLENGAWWAGDAGSTNGIRVESGHSVLGRAGPQAGSAGAKATIEVVPGARIVLSALAQGKPADYPRVLLRQSNVTVSPATPSSPGAKAPTTPVTPIAAPRPRHHELTLTASMASGVRTLSARRQGGADACRSLAQSGHRRGLGARGSVRASHRHHERSTKAGRRSKSMATTASPSTA